MIATENGIEVIIAKQQNGLLRKIGEKVLDQKRITADE